MKNNRALLLTLLVSLLVVGNLFSEKQNLLSDQNTLQINPITEESSHIPSDCVPTFADGGGPYYKSDAPFRDMIAPEEHEGERLVVSGRVLHRDCSSPISLAVLDIWQANESGEYQDEWYRGKVRTDMEGNYTFETVIPKGYGEGTGYRPPHIHFKVLQEGWEIITSQMFFPETKGRPGFDDAYIMKVETEEKKGVKTHFGTHDIILPI